MDPRLQKMARVLAEYSLALRPGDLVMIQAGDVAGPLVREVFYEALLAGSHPYVKATFDGLAEILYKTASEDQLAYISDVQKLEIETLHAALTILGTRNTRNLAGVDPARITVQKRAGLPLTRRLLERIGAGELRWCVTHFPTDAAAQEAGMSLPDFEDFLFAACGLDRDDPVAFWRDLEQAQARWISFLQGIKTLRVTGPDTDLEMRVEGRTWISRAGRETFPDGEIYTSPVEDSVRGQIRFSFPAEFQGREVEDVRLTFQDGQVTRAEASRGLDWLRAVIESDPGASVAGKFAFGTNPGLTRFLRNPLFDDKMGGTMRLGLGASPPGTGGQNASGIHWDLRRDLRPGGEVLADGQVFYRDGQFLI